MIVFSNLIIYIGEVKYVRRSEEMLMNYVIMLSGGMLSLIYKISLFISISSSLTNTSENVKR
jgi:hypothetical protein